MAEKKSFAIYKDLKDKVKALTREDKGALFEAILAWENDDPIPDDLPYGAVIAFDFIRPMLEASEKSYAEKSDNGRNAANKRWEKERSMQTDAEGMRNDAEDMQSDADSMQKVCRRMPKDKHKDKPINELLSNDNNCQSETDTASEASVPEKKQKPVLTKADLQTVKDVWNEKAGGRGVPTLFAISETSTRYKMLKARIQEYGLSKVLEGIDRIAESDFLCHGNKNWKGATFDWFVKPNNFPKVIEGYYSDTRDRASPAVTDNPLDDPDIAGYLRRKHGIH